MRRSRATGRGTPKGIVPSNYQNIMGTPQDPALHPANNLPMGSPASDFLQKSGIPDPSQNPTNSDY